MTFPNIILRLPVMDVGGCSSRAVLDAVQAKDLPAYLFATGIGRRVQDGLWKTQPGPVPMITCFTTLCCSRKQELACFTF